jgi:signal transduction histidine kinase
VPTLRGRLFVPTALLASVIGLTLGVLAFQAREHSAVLGREVDEIRSANALVSALADATADEQRWVLSYELRPVARVEARVARADARIDALVAQVDRIELRPRAAELWRGYVATRALLVEARDELVHAARAHDPRAMSIAFEKWQLATDRADAHMSSFATYHVRRLERAVDDLQRDRLRFLWTAVGAVLLGAALAVAFSIWLAQTLVRPLAAMSTAAERIAEHGLATPVAGADRTDEIGTLARSFNRMTQRLVGAKLGLEEAVRARDEFISIASHELKTPLTPLKLRLQALLREARAPGAESRSARLVEAAQAFEKLVSRIATLVENMLDVSRISSGRLVLAVVRVDAADLLDEAVEHVRDQLERAGCPLRVECADAGPVTIDRVRIGQVIENLLSNAAKYAAGGPVVLRCARDGPDLVVEVEDRGSGIAAADLERIFGRFERAGSASGATGLGLGLFISREIVRAHGGELSVSSRLGEGSTFRVRLPVEPAADAAATPAEGTEAPQRALPHRGGVERPGA